MSWTEYNSPLAPWARRAFGRSSMLRLLGMRAFAHPTPTPSSLLLSDIPFRLIHEFFRCRGRCRNDALDFFAAQWFDVEVALLDFSEEFRIFRRCHEGLAQGRG